MKHLFSLSLLLLALLLTTTAVDAQVEINGIYYIITGNEATVTYKDFNLNSYSGSVTIPATVTYGGSTYSVTSIGDFAFGASTGLNSITIPNSVTKIGNSAFRYCTGLTSITIPNSVTSIGGTAFSLCSGLTSVTIPNSVTYIGNYAFEDCKSLTSVDVGDSQLSIIEEGTFLNCRSLSSVSLPYSITSIGSYAFYYCEKLDQVVCKAITPPKISEYNSIYPGYYMATLYVPERSVEAYRATEFWSNFINIVGYETEDDVPHDAPQQKCDTNDDGEVNISDVNKVIDFILVH